MNEVIHNNAAAVGAGPC